MAVIGVGSQATDSSIHRVWRSSGPKPHLLQTLMLSTDPCFEEKLQDVVGPYFDVQDNAAAFIFDKGTNLDPPSGPVSVPPGCSGATLKRPSESSTRRYDTLDHARLAESIAVEGSL